MVQYYGKLPWHDYTVIPPLTKKYRGIKYFGHSPWYYWKYKYKNYATLILVPWYISRCHSM